MNEPTNVQTIMQDGKPAFVVIPFDEYVRLFPKTPRVPEGDAIPHEVVGLTIKKRYTLVRAWREYLGLRGLLNMLPFVEMAKYSLNI